MKARQALQTALATPDFQTEAEEAAWWANNQDLLANAFKEAAATGTLGRGTLAKRGLVEPRGVTPTTTIRLDPADIELAKAQAEQRGLRYQTYLKSIIHQALAEAAK